MFPKLFQRGVNVSGLADLGSDQVPTDVAYLKLDNAFSTQARAGESVAQRIAVGAIYAGGGAPDPFDFAFYLWDANSKSWLLLPSAAVSVAVGEVGFADVPVVIDPKSSNGSIDLAVLLTVGGSPPDGTYTAVLGSDYGGGTASGSLPAGAATADNQVLEIAQLTTVNTKLNGGLPTALGAGGGLKVDGSGTALPVSLASLPALTTGSATIGAVTGPSAAPLALDATLTGGTQVAQLKAGAKGATTAALATSTANGADHQGLDTVEQFASPAEDNAGTYTGAARIATSRRGSSVNITDQASHNAIKTGVGVLTQVVINKAVALGTIALYDGLTSGGTLIGTITMPATLIQSQVVLTYNRQFTTGLTVVTSAASQDITVCYE
jgi:hypothetical protein